jgi:hypothetical protein
MSLELYFTDANRRRAILIFQSKRPTKSKRDGSLPTQPTGRSIVGSNLSGRGVRSVTRANRFSYVYVIPRGSHVSSCQKTPKLKKREYHVTIGLLVGWRNHISSPFFPLSFQSRTNLQRWIIPYCLSPGNANDDDDKKIRDFFLFFFKKGFWVTKKLVKKKIREKRVKVNAIRFTSRQVQTRNHVL